MRSRKIELPLPWDFYDKLKPICDDEGHRSFARFVLACLITKYVTRLQNPMAVEIANMDPEEQDQWLKIVMNLNSGDYRRSIMSDISRHLRKASHDILTNKTP